MTNQPTLFDAPASEAAKERGIEKAANRDARTLVLGQQIAREMGRRQPTVTADDVQAELERRGEPRLGNAAGSLFRGKEWIAVGYTKSTHIRRHSGMIREWALKGANRND